MIESPRHKKGDVLKIGGENRICVCADEHTAVFCHCNYKGAAIRYYDVLIIHPIHGRYSKTFTKFKSMDPMTLSMKLNKP